MPVYKDEDRNTWYALFYYTDWTGERKRKKKRGFKKKSEAQQWEREFLSVSQRASDMTFASLVDLYEADMKERLRATTMGTKMTLIKKHVLPYFKNLKIDEITAAHVRKWQSELLAQDYAPTYLKTINNQMSAIMNYATKYYGVHANPCKAAGTMGKSNASEMKFWTLEQFEAFIACVDRWPERVAFLLLFWTGMRIGELLALTEHDFDFVRGTVTILKNYQRHEGDDLTYEPKTEKGKRTVSVPATVLEAVKAYIPRLYGYQPGDRLFPYTKDHFYGPMEKASDEAGVERIRLHDLRHSHASLLIEMEVPILLISERLGHEDVQTTLRTYGHLYPNRRDDTAKRLDALMAPPAKEKAEEVAVDAEDAPV